MITKMLSVSGFAITHILKVIKLERDKRDRPLLDIMDRSTLSCPNLINNHLTG